MKRFTPTDRRGRPLQHRTLHKLMLSAFATVAASAALALPGTASAQSTCQDPSQNQNQTFGPGNYTAGYNCSFAGTAGQNGQGTPDAPQNGGPGQSNSAFTITFGQNTTITAGGAGPTVGIGTVGGAGGIGNDAEGHNSGGSRDHDGGADGGLGGTPGLLTWTLSTYTTVKSSSTAADAVAITSAGGAGGYAGGYQKNYGNAGTPGAGGNGGDIQANLSGSIYSSNGWNGATPGTTALLISSTGANGGANPNVVAVNSASSEQDTGDANANPGGAGGNGGNITVVSTTANVFSGTAGIILVSQGGQGSDGSSAGASGGTGYGGNGGAGGNGGTVNLTIGTQSQPTVFSITSIGAATAATGVSIPVTVPDSNNSQQYADAAYPAAAIQLQSFGADGGEGGLANGESAKAGSGGRAGDGGGILLNYSAIGLSTTGFAAPGVVAQSVGGSGGNGSSAGGTFKRKAGNGAVGGDGGSVSLTFFDWNGTTTNSVMKTAGDDSGAVIAQSIGGGGGVGGSVSVAALIGGVAIGGDGETGGVGGSVTIYNGDGTDPNNKPDSGIVITTAGARSSGIVAQSIGGGGGTGGTAQSMAIGPFAYAVGGNGGSGGDAGTPGTTQVAVYNAGIISTTGDHGRGIEAQAIGGGGGSGGSASTLTASAQLNVNVTVGGQGGGAGEAGDVVVHNDGQIITQGADAWGAVAQSIGGGGGNGGASKSEAFQLVNDSEVPSLTFGVTLGGSGAGGGNGGNVTFTNTFSVITAGHGAHAVVAQSIGGGGGNGGDSSSLQLETQGSTFNYSLTIGGSGGVGGTASTVTVNNGTQNIGTGLLWTMGSQANGVLAQSISGGGGNGGVGSADTSMFKGDPNASSEFNFAIGGEGGNGADASQTTVNNYSGILTTGDGSDAILAQSIGGGGGNGGGAMAHGTGGTANVEVAVGGAGGSGGNGGNVYVNNYANGAVMTTRADSAGILAQSIGGAGGKGGRAAVGGGVSPEKLIEDYLNVGQYVSSAGLAQHYGNGSTTVTGWASKAQSVFDDLQTLQSLYNDYQNANNGATPATDGEGGGDFSVSLTVGAVQAGGGGSGGTGGTVQAFNQGQILTEGPASPGIHVQSVGGGGGKGGALNVSTSASASPGSISGTLAIGGKRGASGEGGLAQITNAGPVTTYGDQSHGLIAQSVGGGGGMGGYTATTPTSSYALAAELGGDGGVVGNGGGYASSAQGAIVQNYDVAATKLGTSVVTTRGDDAVGIVAQNIGGGGGTVSVMQTATDASGAAISKSTPTQVDFGLGAKNRPSNAGCNTVYEVAACGSGGGVYVNSDTVATAGRNAYGVLAQSIGGSGGWLVGGSVSGSSVFNNTASTVGDGGQIEVYIHGSVATQGDGAIGVLAQSIGGGGLLGGNTAAGEPSSSRFTANSATSFNQGSGGEVDVTVFQGGSITTSGANAHGIYAQSVGGGGGFVTSSDQGWLEGSAGGMGSSGQVDIEIDGSVTTNGANAAGVYVNTDAAAASSNYASVTVSSTGSVTATQGDAIVINGNAVNNSAVDNANVVINNGVISASETSLAVAARGASTGIVNVTNNPGGTITGGVSIGSGTIDNAGLWQAGIFNTANVVNQSGGTIAFGQGLGYSAPFVNLTGNLTSTGTLQFTVDFAAGTATKAVVSGNADIPSGTIKLIPTSMQPQAVTIMEVGGQASLGTLNVQDGGQFGLYQYQLSTLADPNVPGQTDIQVTPQAQFTAVARNAGLSKTEQAVAGHLQASFAAGSPALGEAFAQLGRIANLAQYKQALDSLSNESVNAVGTARLAASQGFVARMNSCPEFEGTGTLQQEQDCAWGRVVGNWTDRQANASAVGYTVDSKVLQLGGQKEFAKGWFLGGSLAYDSSSFDADANAGDVDGKGVTLGAILKREIGQWLISGAVDAGYGWYDSTRNITLGSSFSSAQGSFNGQHAGVHGRIAYQIPRQGWYLKPYLDLHAIYQRTDAYTETGAGALDLTVESSSATRLAASPMLEVGGRIDLRGDTTLMPFIGVGGLFYDKNEWTASASLAGSSAGPFQATASLPTAQLNLYTGATLMSGKNLQIRLEYSGQFAEDFTSSTGSLKLSYLF
jgi:uncharacterized protein YhjY with autotransporter beta-barrel domain